MAAGVAPIRARKARYFRDRRLMARVLPPPAVGGTPKPRTDDWSLLPEPQRPAPKAATAAEEESEASATENAGIRQEPELQLPENIAPVPPAPAGEFDFGAGDSQDGAADRKSVVAGKRGSVSVDVGGGH